MSVAMRKSPFMAGSESPLVAGETMVEAPSTVRRLILSALVTMRAANLIRMLFGMPVSPGFVDKANARLCDRPAASAAPARLPAPPAAQRSRRPSPQPPPAAGPAAHAAPHPRQADRAHRTQAPSLFNLNYNFKIPRIGVSRPPAPASPLNGHLAPIFALHDIDYFYVADCHFDRNIDLTQEAALLTGNPIIERYLGTGEQSSEFLVYETLILAAYSHYPHLLRSVS